MFRRCLSMLLIVVLTAAGVSAFDRPALATTAQEALFGNGTAHVSEPSDASAPDAPDAGSANDSDEPVVSSIDEYQTLQLGDRDEADETAYIVTLQNRLIALGFLRDAADGVYGENTRTAVEQFQKLNGLEQTGVADPATQRLVFSDMSGLTTPSPDNQIAYGSEAVRVQTKLASWGFLDGAVDGKLGKDSEAAIITFKNYANQYCPTPSPTPEPTPTPIPTPEPGELPLAIDIPLTTPTPEPTPYVATGEVDDLVRTYVDGALNFQIFRETVQNGSSGDEVRRVQTRLKQLNYLYPDADGVFGANTERALKYFQRKHGLAETGIADQATQQMLFSEDAQRSEEYVFPYKLVVDISDQRVYVYSWEGEDYSGEVGTMICSTGRDSTPTPTGTYQAYGQLSGEWYYFKNFNCYAKWAYGIVGGILFHSVTFNTHYRQTGSEKNLGRKASHGCVRLSVDNAKWIYDNCPYGTTVVIQE